MDKIIVHLIVPAIGQEYDMYIPTTILVNELTKLIIQSIKELTEQFYVSSGSEILCLKDRNCIIDQEETVESYGIQNGDHIVLI